MPPQPIIFDNAPDRPIVSALVSAYNAEKWIDGCIKDLLAQTILGDLQIVVIDSGSDDATPDLVHGHIDTGRITYIRTQHREHLYRAWNRGLALSRGRHITIANVDDRHAPQALEALSSALDESDDVALVYATGFYTTSETFSWDDPHAVGRLEAREFSPHDLKRECYIHPHPMWRAALHEKYGLFDESFTSAGDYEWFLRLIAGGERFLYLPRALSIMYKTDKTLGNAKMAVSVAETRRAQMMWGRR